MSIKANERTVRRIYDELWNERMLEVADEVIAGEAPTTTRGSCQCRSAPRR